MPKRQNERNGSREASQLKKKAVISGLSCTVSEEEKWRMDNGLLKPGVLGLEAENQTLATVGWVKIELKL